MNVAPLKPAEARSLCIEYLGIFGKQLDNAQLSIILANQRVRNPLYLLTFLQEVRVFGSFETLTSRIDYYMESKTITDMFLRVIRHLEEDFDSPAAPHLVRYTLCVMACARAGINERELKTAVESALGTKEFPNMTFAALMIRLESSLIDQHGLKIFSHSYLRDAIVRYYLGATAIAPAPVKVPANLLVDASTATTAANGAVVPSPQASSGGPGSLPASPSNAGAPGPAKAAPGRGAPRSRTVSAPHGRELRVFCHQLLSSYFTSTKASARKVQELPWHVYVLCLISAQANADPDTVKAAQKAAAEATAAALRDSTAKEAGKKGGKMKMSKKKAAEQAEADAAAAAEAADPGAAEATAASLSAASEDSIMAITMLPLGAFGPIDAALADRLADLLTDVALFPIFKLTEFKFDLHKYWQLLERHSPGRKYARPAKAYYATLKKFQVRKPNIDGFFIYHHEVFVYCANSFSITYTVFVIFNCISFV